MKIGFEAKRIFHNRTGLGNYSRDLINGLSKYFPENTYFLYNPKISKTPLFASNNSSVFEKFPKKQVHKKLTNFWRQKGIISDLLQDEIVIFHGLSGELPVGLKSTNIKSIVTIHDLIFLRYPHLYSFFDRKIHYLKFKKAAMNADKIIAISEQTKKDIVSYLKVDPNKIVVVYQGCQEVFKNNFTIEEKNEVVKRYTLPERYILNVGTIEERKNALTIVKAIQNIDTTLVIVGKETKYTSQIKNYIKENNIAHKVLFLKGLSSKELAITYQLATVFVYPSIFEGFGIPIIEALYSKVPVITNKFGVFPEAGGPDSLYVDPAKPDQLSAQINILLNNPDLRASISAKGFEFVQKFNDKLISREIMTIYEKLIGDEK
jgi:glycosyltransferase involved in cell wall biosynthesis